MEKLLLLLCWVATAHTLVPDFHHKLRQKRQADLIDFNDQCTRVFRTMDVNCLTNIYSLIETYKSVEKEAVKSWGSQCQSNIYDCISSPDAETDQVIEYFKVLLPQIKSLCANGCMVPIIDLIHSCLKQEALDEIGLSRAETEDIFDLLCIQEDNLDNGEQGEYCMIKAMTTASYLFEANQIKYCNLDAIDLTSCGQGDNPSCQCNANCSTLIKSGNALMGCCMGTLLELEKAFNMSHPDSTDLLHPGNQLFTLCGVTPGKSCKTSKKIIAEQKKQFDQCNLAMYQNDQSGCIKLENDTHNAYLANMQNIHNSCEKKNINQCVNPTSKVLITGELVSIMSKLHGHCEECAPELAGIRDNCTVFLSEEAKMVFEMLCLHNSDMEACATRVILYETERERVDLNSNPCFQGFMPNVQNQCSPECIQEVEMMNKYQVLNCFDALMDHSSYTNPAWQLWHKNCVMKPNIEIQNKINVTSVYDFSKGKNSDKNSIVKTVAYTIVGTVLVAFVIVGVVVLFYKRHIVLNMFGYSKFSGEDNLIADVHMEDTMGDSDDDRGENYYD